MGGLEWLVSCSVGALLIVFLGAVLGKGWWGLAVAVCTTGPDMLRGLFVAGDGWVPLWWWGSWPVVWPGFLPGVLALLYLLWGVYPGLLVWWGCRGRSLVAIFVVIGTAAMISWMLPIKPPWMVGASVRAAGCCDIFAQVVSADVSPVAAFPSVHVAVPCVLALVERSRWWGAYAGVTAVVVVLAGEHWVVDVVGGAGLAGVVWAAMIAGGFSSWIRRAIGERRVWSRHNSEGSAEVMRKGVAGQ